MYAFLNKNNHKDDNDHNDDDGAGKETNIITAVTIKKGGGDHKDEYFGVEEGDAPATKLSIKQHGSHHKMRAYSSTSSNWSVETNEEYDKIVKELAADAGSSDEEDDDDDDDDEDDEDVNIIMKQGMVKEDFLDMIATSTRPPMGGNKVDHPIQAMMKTTVMIGMREQRERGSESGRSGDNSSKTPTKQSTNPSLVIDDEEENDELPIIMDTNSEMQQQGKSTRLQLNRRKNLTRLLVDLAGKAQSMRESLTDPHAKENSNAAVDAMEKMAVGAAAAVEVEETASNAQNNNNALDYHPPAVPGTDNSSSSQLIAQKEQPLQRKAESLDGSSNYYYLPTKSIDGKQSSWKLPTLPRPTSTRKGKSNRRASVESESMWTRRNSSENSSSSGGMSYWLQSSLNKKNIEDKDDTMTNGGGHDDEREGGFNDSQLSLDSEIMQHHTIDEENLQDVLNDIIRGRRRRRGTDRKEGAVIPGEEEEVENEDESPFHFERGGNQHYRPSQQTLHRCIGILFSVAVIIVSAALIGISVQNKKRAREGGQDSIPNHVMALTTTGNTTMDETISTIMTSLPHGQYSKSDLFYMAKSVNDNCRADQFVTAAGRWECQHICHAHFCCFDFDEEDGNYNCLDDVNKLCPIFAGCEILVSHDFVGSGSYTLDGLVNDESHEEEDQMQQQNSGGESSSSSKMDDAQEIIKENERGWQEVRRKYIIAHCDESNIATDTGREQCEKACEHHYCCFDTEAGGSCTEEPNMTCHVYAACQVLSVGQLDDEANGSDPYILATTALPVTSAIPIPPDMLGEVVLPPNHLNGDESDEPIQYTNDELLQMQADVRERCSDTQTPTGRFHCENICQFHYCCFDTSTDGCSDDPTNLCEVYDFCKVLVQPLSSSVENNEEESATPQMALISAEEEYEEMGSYAPAQSVVVVHDSYAPSQSAVHDSYAPAHSIIVVHDFYAPAQSIIVVQESAAPTPIPTPVPVLIPISPSLTSPPIGMITAITSGAGIHSEKPPPRPPIRCVPDGDDEVNIEVFSDDWNDDRFDRCARWESKYNMTITEYWDLYGTSQLT